MSGRLSTVWSLLALLGLADAPPGGRERLFAGWRTFFERIAEEGTVALVFEDLQWADPSFLNFLRLLVSKPKFGIIFLYTYRPPFTLFGDEAIAKMGEAYQEIQIQELSPGEIQEMLASLLQTAAVPEDLQRFVREKVETNPFYLEEMLNNGPYRLAFRTVIDVYTGLPKSHERPHADSADDQGVCLILMEQIDGGLASSLSVRGVFEDGHVANLAVFHLYQRENVTMPEVPGTHRVESSRVHGRYGYGFGKHR